MLNSAIELISLTDGVNYSPTFISTDKRVGNTERTTIGYWQIGEDQQYGFAKGPLFKVEFADLSSVSAGYVKIWALENRDSDAPIYPVTYLINWKPLLEIYLKKFIFCDSSGNAVEAGGDYSIIGYKKRAMPLAW